MTSTTIEARVYVGTYAKYSAGSIAGQWLTLDEYADYDEFLTAAKALHADESDPELMFQDHEGIPAGMVSESHIDAEVWDWLALDESDREMLSVYRENVNSSGTIDEANEAFDGTHPSESDWAADYWDQSGMLNQIPESLQRYIDYDAYARDARIGGDMVFVQHGGEVWAFRNI